YLIRTGVFLIVVIGLYSFLGGEFGFLNLLRMERNRSLLEMEKRELTAEIVDLEVHYKRLLSDSLFIQKLAREKYGLARDGEVIIRVPEDISYRPE
ncbi:MAG: septum formation initiator family protein, partial [candidate division Zixibacteria bacterium]|nr:septum formation initiator family protein [candidate division Zixibacteria bacterium]